MLIRQSGQSSLTLKRVASNGSMAPCRSCHTRAQERPDAGTHRSVPQCIPRHIPASLDQVGNDGSGPPALFINIYIYKSRLEREKDEERKKGRSFTSMQMLHTHTPGRSRVNPERQEEEKSGHTTGRRPKNSAGGGGEQTDLRNQPTRRNGPDKNRERT